MGDGKKKDNVMALLKGHGQWNDVNGKETRKHPSGIDKIIFVSSSFIPSLPCFFFFFFKCSTESYFSCQSTGCNIADMCLLCYILLRSMSFVVCWYFN